MTAHIGDHVHPVDQPDLDLEIDVVAPQGSAATWYSTHDRDGNQHHVCAADVEHHGRHRGDNPTLTPATMLLDAEDDRRLSGTISGVLR